MRQAIGWFLMGVPVWAIIIAGIMDKEWRGAMIEIAYHVGIPLVMAGSVGLGLWLVFGG